MKKSLGRWLPDELYQKFKELMPTFQKLHQKTEEETNSYSFQKGSIMIILKPEKKIHHKKLQADISFEQKLKSHQYNTSTLKIAICKKDDLL